MKKLTFSWIFVISLSILGIIVLSTILHEEFHRFDLKNIEKTNEQICYLSPSKNIGFYTFEVKSQEEQNKVEEIRKFTEYKAYSVDIIITLIYAFCLMNIIYGRKKDV